MYMDRDSIFQIVKSMYKSMSAIFWSNPVQGLGSPPANTSMSSSQSLQQSVLTFLLSSTHTRTGTTDWWHFISMYNNNLTEYFQLSWKLNMYSRFYEVVQLFVEQSKDNCFSMTKYREGYRYKVALGGVTTIWYH